MVKGLDKFREYFADFSEQYVLIGGAACDIFFNEVGADFRATKDLDVVLVVEALTKEFGQLFWSSFVREGISIGPGAMEVRSFTVLKNRKIRNFLK